MKIRKSNLELCRIVCMLLIIAHHCVVHGGSINIEPCINRTIAMFLVPGGKLCFDAFLALSTWFLVDQDFRTERFLKIWLEVFFYSVTFAVITYIIQGGFTWRTWFSIFFPITGNSHGFAAAYLLLYLLIPFLSKVKDNLNKTQTQILLLLLIYAQIGSQLIGNISGYFQMFSSEILLFVLCYFIAFYIKNWPFKLQNNKPFLILGVVLFWIMLFAIRYGASLYPDSSLFGYLMAITADESSIFNLIGGYLLFLFFYSLPVKNSKIINQIAKPTFGILLIHDHNFFRPVVWYNIIHADTWYDSDVFLIRIILATLFIYIVGSLIDYARMYLLEKPIFKSEKLKQYCKRIDNVINESTYTR